MRRNRAAVLIEPRSVRIEERPVPTPRHGEVLIALTAVGVCGSDVHYFEHGRIGSYEVREPLVLGHESAGTIAALGPGVTRRAVGERVAVEPGVPCGRCRECRAGRYNLCADVVFLGTPPVDGAFTNYIAIHEDFAYPLPDTVSDDAGALMEPLSVAVWACRKARVSVGDRVLITGAGPIGLLTMQVARAFGATRVEISDVKERRLALARRTGATRAFAPGEEQASEADVFIECSGNRGALSTGIAALRPAGTAVAVGMGPDGNASLPIALIQNREIWLTGVFRYANTYPTAIALVADGLVNLDAIITDHFALQDTERALRAGRDDPGSVKAIVHPGAVPS
jgi:L-iditol 2-dehydrogenase